MVIADENPHFSFFPLITLYKIKIKPFEK